MSPDVALVSCAALPEPDPDAAPLRAALEARGLSVATWAWDGGDRDWTAPGLAVLRSTWNYYLDRPGFLDWAARVERLVNPLEVIRWNTHKRYLLDLAGASVPAVPTALIERGAAADLSELVESRGWSEAVIKPAVSAASFETHRWSPGDDPAPFDRLVAERDVLVQPFLPSVADRGERSIVAIEGVITHSVRKAPRFGDAPESVTGPHPIDDGDRALAEAALAHVADRFGAPLLYARIDCVRDAAGEPAVAELELTEPSLFFPQSPAALERFVAGILRRLP